MLEVVEGFDLKPQSNQEALSAIKRLNYDKLLRNPELQVKLRETVDKIIIYESEYNSDKSKNVLGELLMEIR